MSTVTAADLITVWERGQGLSLPGRAYAMLGVLEARDDELAGLSVGQRDGLLMDLRQVLFGSRVVSVIDCPDCRERMEVTFALDDIRVRAPGDPAEVVDVEADGYRVRCRPPTQRDLMSLDSRDPACAGRSLLLRRSVIGAFRAGTPVEVDHLPDQVVGRISAALAAADPQADVELALTCPVCGHSWNAVFDIVSFLWDELDTWTRRMATEVHVLAHAYGWSEAEITAMSAQRRSLYLELVWP